MATTRPMSTTATMGSARTGTMLKLGTGGGPVAPDRPGGGGAPGSGRPAPARSGRPRRRSCDVGHRHSLRRYRVRGSTRPAPPLGVGLRRGPHGRPVRLMVRGVLACRRPGDRRPSATGPGRPPWCHQRPRWTRRRRCAAGRAAEVDGGSGRAGSPSSTAPSHRGPAGTPSPSSRASSPRKLPEERGPEPTVGGPEQQGHDGEGGVDVPVGDHPLDLGAVGPGLVGLGVAVGVGVGIARRPAPPPAPGTVPRTAGTAPASRRRWWRPSSGAVCPAPSSTTRSRPWVLPADGARQGLAAAARPAPRARGASPGSSGSCAGAGPPRANSICGTLPPDRLSATGAVTTVRDMSRHPRLLPTDAPRRSAGRRRRRRARRLRLVVDDRRPRRPAVVAAAAGPTTPAAPAR